MTTTGNLQPPVVVEVCLEEILQRELQNAWVTRGAEGTERPARARHAGGDGRALRDRADPFREVEVRTVEEIEELRPELQPVALGERDVLQQRKVHVVRPGTFQDVATRRAQRAERLQYEGVGVEKSRDCLLIVRQVRVTDHIRSAVANDTQAVVLAIGAEVSRERQSRLLGDDASHLPIAEYGVEVFASELHRQVICEADYQPVLDVEARPGPF